MIQKKRQKVKTFFRLYSDFGTEFQSSIFDLITGDKETKQTKGLAYLLSQDRDLLLDFLKHKPVADAISSKLGCKLNPKTITAIEVCAERYTTNKERADILIRIDANNQPTVVIIIEAKSIKANPNFRLLVRQLESYLEKGKFLDFSGYKKIGVALTKYSHTHTDIVNITWGNIIEILFKHYDKHDSGDIGSQYFNFLTGIDKTMKFYEKEVLSIPAGKSSDLIEKCNVYVCPDTKSYNYKKPLFVGFRKSGGGIIEKLYKIEEIIIFNPTIPSELESFKNSTYSEEVKKRVLDYIKNDSPNHDTEVEHDSRFYVLSKTDIIKLRGFKSQVQQVV